jgi:hypothetical protein
MSGARSPWASPNSPLLEARKIPQLATPIVPSAYSPALFSACMPRCCEELRANPVEAADWRARVVRAERPLGGPGAEDENLRRSSKSRKRARAIASGWRRAPGPPSKPKPFVHHRQRASRSESDYATSRHTGCAPHRIREGPAGRVCLATTPGAVLRGTIVAAVIGRGRGARGRDRTRDPRDGRLFPSVGTDRRRPSRASTAVFRRPRQGWSTAGPRTRSRAPSRALNRL